jgi:hypothetical protein
MTLDNTSATIEHQFIPGATLTNFFSIKTLRTTFLLICLGLLSACATTPSPSTAGSVSFGDQPNDYKNIITAYLKNKPTRRPLNLENMEFLNEPNKFIFEQLNQEKFGYRVCVLINTQDARDLRSHFFLINNGKVSQHLHDSGLIPLSSKFCDVKMLALESRLAAAPVAAAEVVDENGFKYITCNTSSGKEVFFALNADKHQLLQQHDGQLVASFDITDLTDTFIVAEAGQDDRISINRVSGTLLHQQNGSEHQAHCELSSKQQF